MLRKLARKLIYRYKSDSDSYVSFLRAQGASIGNDVLIYEPTSNFFGLNNAFNLCIGNHVRITHGVSIIDHGFDWCVLKVAYGDVLGCTGQVTIGDNVFIGAGATILKDVSIGNNCIIGAGSVVTHSIPDNSVAAGNPCRVIMTLAEYRQKRKDAQLDEAVQLYWTYRHTHSGQDPEEELFREYFWLFTRPDNDGRFECEEFWNVMHLMDDSYEKSFQVIASKPARFDSFDSFIEYCKSQDCFNAD